MLFNSIEFLCIFLPLTVTGYYLLRQRGYAKLATLWLTLFSLGFYGWWNPPYLLLLLASIAMNYGFGRAIAQVSRDPEPRSFWCWRSHRHLTMLGIGLNLALIGYYKYANFFLDTVDTLLGSELQIAPIVLPLAISFFTFQQIAYLIDVDRGHATPYNLTDYTLFVAFFPQLIAGPIVHHQEMMPQFARAKLAASSKPLDLRQPRSHQPRSHHLAVGLTIFTVGLIKKIWIADPIATLASPLFDAASTGQVLTTIEAWSAALFYTFQLYFDFSGYSDMAIGAARLFGIVLPFNFNSPYKATSISEFWRRWHITLSNFLRDYLYIPLGGNRSGNPFLNVLITMLLGGLWHGAGWTFIVWGGLHGVYLGVDRAWRWVWPRFDSRVVRPRWLRPVGYGLAWCLTFLAVLVGWVIFRADRLSTAGSILRSMVSFQADSMGELIPLHGAIVVLLFLVVGFAPNLLEIMHRYQPALEFRVDDRTTPPRWLTWNPTPGLGVILGLVMFLALQTLLLAPESEFLYFQF